MRPNCWPGLQLHRVHHERSGGREIGGREADPKLAEADIAFGQPDVQQIMDLAEFEMGAIEQRGVYAVRPPGCEGRV